MGYPALTSVSIAGVPLPALIDSGASVSAIPEEIVLTLMEISGKSGIPKDSERYPIAQIDTYDQGQGLMGIDSSVKAMTARYAVVLLVEFIPASGSLGENCNPVKPVHFKVLPKK